MAKQRQMPAQTTKITRHVRGFQRTYTLVTIRNRKISYQ